MLDAIFEFTFTILSISMGLLLGTMLVDWYRKNSR